MVAPKYKAVEFTNRDEIREAINEIGRLRPDVKKIQMLIDKFNEAHNSNVFTLSKYMGCGDCQRTLLNFWKYIISEWNKQS